MGSDLNQQLLVVDHEGGDYPQGLLTFRFPQTILLALHILTEFSFYRKTSRFLSRIHFKVLDPGVVGCLGSR